MDNLASEVKAMLQLPELGVGIVYFPALQPLLEVGGRLIDVLEIEPQTYWLKDSAEQQNYRFNETTFQPLLHFPQAKIVHGVGIPVGGALDLNENQMPLFLESVAHINPPWVSEHLAFLEADSPQGSYNTGFLLPPVQSPETIANAIRNIRQFQSRLSVPFAFENPVNYLKPLAGEIADSDFLATIAEEADCGIVLDLHNLWCNQLNGRQTVREVIDRLPLERVWEIHLAGGDQYNNYWLDAHSDLVPEPLMELCWEILPKLPNLKAIIFEIMPDYIAAKSISLESLVEQLSKLHSLWAIRGKQINPPKQQQDCLTLSPRDQEWQYQELPPSQVWESTLGLLANQYALSSSLQQQLQTDPGIQVLQHLITSVRAGNLVSLLPRSYRLMFLSLGTPGIWAVMENYWAQSLPEPFAAAEVRRFGEYIQSQQFDVPYLHEVLAYELAYIEALQTGQATSMRFSCNPAILFECLTIGKIPEQLPFEEYTLMIEP